MSPSHFSAPLARRRWARAGVAAAASLSLLALTTPPTSADDDRDDRDDRSFELAEDLREDVRGKRIMKHLAAFDEIGRTNGNSRASGTPGYKASVDYVVKELRKSGYQPTVQAFDFPFFEELEPARLVTSGGQELPTGTFTYSGSGNPTAPVQGVDLKLAGDRASTSGCEAADFNGFTPGNIALIQRGTCTFGTKANHAADAGASGVIIFNQGNSAGRMDVIVGTLGEPMPTPIPVVGASFDDGAALAAQSGDVEVFAKTISEIRETWNVFAETEAGDPDNVVMTGSHLDSVAAGPGVNDNGSGSAAILEVAKVLAEEADDDEDLPNKVRFAWWGAEELGLLGAEHYIGDLQANSPEELERIALYLNFDMIGSPNYARFVYDGDNSRFPVGPGAAAGPKGSDAIEQAFHDAFADHDRASEETPFSGRSDYGPFIAKGVDIPAGGLFTGAEGVKSAQQAAYFGGEAGVAYDKCYHQACDDLSNVSRQAIDEMSDAVAKVIGMFAVSTQPVNGIGAEWPALGYGAPVGDGTTGGGGLHDDHDHEPES
ncbi:M28 family peptidase [Nocardioides coralli]|uniref:M28 family peptidase n=1 Tax=Nocardioides coralli TaxID=2872154 RepID=UPI001CA3E9AF|nr:M28 family peptidase [Nocardioides coralli]QZY29142.1 M28 family peptidase [Nocardioides coralli]